MTQKRLLLALTWPLNPRLTYLAAYKVFPLECVQLDISRVTCHPSQTHTLDFSPSLHPSASPESAQSSKPVPSFLTTCIAGALMSVISCNNILTLHFYSGPSAVSSGQPEKSLQNRIQTIAFPCTESLSDFLTWWLLTTVKKKPQSLLWPWGLALLPPPSVAECSSPRASLPPSVTPSPLLLRSLHPGTLFPEGWVLRTKNSHIW